MERILQPRDHLVSNQAFECLLHARSRDAGEQDPKVPAFVQLMCQR